MFRKLFIILAALMSFLIAAQASAADPDKAGIVAVAATGTTPVTFTAPASHGG